MRGGFEVCSIAAPPGRIRGMDEQKPSDPSPNIAQAVAGLAILSGFVLMHAAIPIALWFALPTTGDGWPWIWTLALGVAIALVIAVVGYLLLLVAQIICWRQWGYWPRLFCNVRNRESGSA